MNRISTLFVCGFFGSIAAMGQAVGDGHADQPFAEQTDVVAVDRLVGVDTRDMAGWLRGGKLPRGLELSDFRAVAISESPISESRADLRPVGLEAVVRGLPENAGSWNVVVLVDGALASTRTLRWACGLLAEQAEQLTDLGSVTVATTLPEPTTVLPATDDPERLHQMLSRLALVGEGDDTVMSRRWRWLETPEPDDSDSDAYAAAEAESFAVRGALDERLLFLSGVAQQAGPRRLLLWLTDGFDLRTSPFYGAAGEPEAADGSTLEDHALDVERALAADGWIVLPLRPPEADPYRGRAKGKRIGKWRFLGFPPFVAGVRESGRDPEASESYLEIGDQKLAAGDVEGAADAYDRAFYHFWNDPRTSDRQAMALLRLADCLERLDDADGARRARGLAAQLDPEVAARHLTVDSTAEGTRRPDVARRLDSDAPLRRLAAATSGQLIGDELTLDDRLYELARRLRLTLQLPEGLGEGVHRVEITWRDVPVQAPAWVRVGVAPAVRDARWRRGETP